MTNKTPTERLTEAFTSHNSTDKVLHEIALLEGEGCIKWKYIKSEDISDSEKILRGILQDGEAYVFIAQMDGTPHDYLVMLGEDDEPNPGSVPYRIRVQANMTKSSQIEAWHYASELFSHLPSRFFRFNPVVQ